jgi:hypothetical protein
MVEEPGTPTSRKRAHELLQAEIAELSSDESEGEIADLPFKTMGQLKRYLDNRQRKIQQTMDRLEKAFPGNSVLRVQFAGILYLTTTLLAGTTSQAAADKPDKTAHSLGVQSDTSIPPLDPKRLITSKVCHAFRDV